METHLSHFVNGVLWHMWKDLHQGIPKNEVHLKFETSNEILRRHFGKDKENATFISLQINKNIVLYLDLFEDIFKDAR